MDEIFALEQVRMATSSNQRYEPDFFFLFQINSQSDFIWHSHSPEYCPESLCGLNCCGRLPSETKTVTTSKFFHIQTSFLSKFDIFFELIGVQLHHFRNIILSKISRSTDEVFLLRASLWPFLSPCYSEVCLLQS
jgi:hypothetical protein